ncbi:enoyl-CoA delta isomerase 2-like isoform X2 [Portunus trituberculatus]|uniref:enoyl-CoA delta isomerase 2-like isoform X2 n=1 Tax=Portunus trituberculatus TaxID=210409 RepID=UPI001E1CB78B|nr:enoyl-CoA delta isomerase 2-like isoform X2 [Portunus trituberculatus]XP_045109298.1 enoyl-CoA delta isomerase 2-like isoform X2 [Portunus trituberculatus]XP_045109299.1 enoyl-CoA delta isomerase 2-like isoform X2 [Portunus trituberculatus]
MNKPTMESKEAALDVSVEDRLCVVKFNRPHKKNAFRAKEYRALMATLDRAAGNPDVTVVAVTGEGDYFTSGNDFMENLQNMGNHQSSAEGTEVGEKKSSSSVNLFRDFISALINFPKPLVAVLNGPAVGMGVTMLPLFDVVYASDKATFHTPFVQLGLVAEGCSSYIFPRLMGMGKAAEVLLFGKKLTAEEASDRGLVTEVLPHSNLHQIWPRIREYAKLPLKTLLTVKEMMRAKDRETLIKVNKMEMEYLKKAARSEEALTGIMNMFAKKSKL